MYSVSNLRDRDENFIKGTFSYIRGGEQQELASELTDLAASWLDYIAETEDSSLFFSASP